MEEQVMEEEVMEEEVMEKEVMEKEVIMPTSRRRARMNVNVSCKSSRLRLVSTEHAQLGTISFRYLTGLIWVRIGLTDALNRMSLVTCWAIQQPVLKRDFVLVSV